MAPLTSQAYGALLPGASPRPGEPAEMSWINRCAADILRATPDLIAIADLADYRLLSLNSAGRRLLGFAETEPLPEIELTDLYTGRSLPTLLYQILPAALSNGNAHGELALSARDGREVPVSQVAVTHAAPDKSTVLLAIIARDISETKTLHEELRKEQRLLTAFLENVPEYVYFKDISGRYLRISRSKALKHGLAQSSDGIGKTDFDYFALEHADRSLATERRIIASGESIVGLEERTVHPDGRVIWVGSTKLPLRDEEGRIIGTFGISRDITARKQAEQEREQMELQLRHAQRLEAIGRLSAGVAHEINTPLQYVSDNTRFLRDGFSACLQMLSASRALAAAVRAGTGFEAELDALEGAASGGELDYLSEEIPRALDQSLDGLERVSRIVGALKEFSHPGKREKTPVDLNHALANTLVVARHEWKYVAEVATEFDPTLPLVPCLPDEFNQAVLNLIINAAHAIGDATENGAKGKGKITLRTAQTAEWAVVSVSDTGCGIPEAVRDRIFEPFFTTKEAGRGTGQGLAIVRTVIVTKHGGTVTYESEPGRGTTFHLRLPLKAPSAPAPISS